MFKGEQFYRQLFKIHPLFQLYNYFYNKIEQLLFEEVHAFNA
jgi:hypothetical protein